MSNFIDEIRNRLCRMSKLILNSLVFFNFIFYCLILQPLLMIFCYQTTRNHSNSGFLNNISN